jgi:phasin
MANAPKRSAVPPKVSAAAPVEAAATPVETAVATVNAVVASEAKSAAAPAAEIQQSVRSALEKGVVESRAAFAKAKAAADETASAFEVSFAAAKDGALAINTKAFEALRVNADANFDFLKAVFAVKSLPDLIALQTEFARKQVETITGQSKDFGALAQKAMADAVEPIKEQVARSFKLAV